MASPTLKQNNGTEIPALGLGTYLSGPGEVAQAVKDAIDAGYRHFDCAHLYGNEKEVGDGIRAKIADGTVKREELFVTSKLWNTYHKQDMVVPMCKRTLQHLQLDYVDLYLMHWPFAWKEGDDLWPMDNNGEMIFSDVDYIETWRGLEQCYELGLVRSIGVSNFNSEQLDRLLAVARVKPVNNQVEVHPLLNQRKLIEFCARRDIVVTGYCPLGRPATHFNFLNDPQIRAIGSKYGKSAAQVVLKYLLSLGISVIPKSTNKQRIIENISVFDFTLAPEDIAIMDTFNRNMRVCGFEENSRHKYYPFNIEY